MTTAVRVRAVIRMDSWAVPGKCYFVEILGFGVRITSEPLAMLDAYRLRDRINDCWSQPEEIKE